MGVSSCMQVSSIWKCVQRVEHGVQGSDGCKACLVYTGQKLTYSKAGTKGQALVDSKIVIKVQPDVLGDGSHLLNILISAASDTEGFVYMAHSYCTC